MFRYLLVLYVVHCVSPIRLRDVVDPKPRDCILLNLLYSFLIHVSAVSFTLRVSLTSRAHRLTLLDINLWEDNDLAQVDMCIDGLQLQFLTCLQSHYKLNKSGV